MQNTLDDVLKVGNVPQDAFADFRMPTNPPELILSESPRLGQYVLGNADLSNVMDEPGNMKTSDSRRVES